MSPTLEKQADANELELSGTAVSPFEDQKQLNRSYQSVVPAISSKNLWALNLARVVFSFNPISVLQHIAGNPLNRYEQESSVGLEAEFNRRAERWIKDTSFQSSLGSKFMHEDYQTIMAMGTPVIPLILARLKEKREHWFWALKHLAKKDVAQGTENPSSAAKAWLKWGKEQGYID